MHDCVLCLEGTDAQNDGIEIFGPEAVELQLEKVLEHFFSQLKLNTTERQLICRNCWNAVYAFHEFFERIVDAHNRLKTVASDTKITFDDSFNSHTDSPMITTEDIKLEPPEVVKVESIENFAISTTPTNATPRRTRSQMRETTKAKAINSSDLTKILENAVCLEELCVVDVQNEEQEHDTDIMNQSEEYPANRTRGRPRKILGQKRSVNKKSKEFKTSNKYSRKTQLTENYNKFIADNWKLSCCLCNLSLDTFLHLKHHFRTEHQRCGYVLCCGKKLGKKGLLVDHINVHLNPEYFKCKQCDKILADRRCLELHMKVHSKQKERIYKCYVCKKSYYLENVYRRHLSLHASEEQKIFKCEYCQKGFAIQYMMMQHINTVHRNLYVKICDICGKTLRTRAGFVRHQQDHAGVSQKLLECEICGLKVTNKYGLKKHMRTMHVEENLQPQVCDICQRVSPGMGAHLRHINFMHKLERKHQCQLCDKAFKRPKDLKEHMCTHTGQKLYVCTFCPRAFSSNANMYSHRKKKHQEEWAKHSLQKFKKTHNEKALACVEKTEEAAESSEYVSV